jgi:hypothetical protein
MHLRERYRGYGVTETGSSVTPNPLMHRLVLPKWTVKVIRGAKGLHAEQPELRAIAADLSASCEPDTRC